MMMEIRTETDSLGRAALGVRVLFVSHVACAWGVHSRGEGTAPPGGCGGAV